jgi:hypothetical protein
MEEGRASVCSPNRGTLDVREPLHEQGVHVGVLHLHGQ